MADSFADNVMRKKLTSVEVAITGKKCCMYCMRRVPVTAFVKTTNRPMCVSCNEKMMARKAAK